MKSIKENKKNLKRISLAVCFILFIGLIEIHSTNVNATDTFGNQPAFTVNIDSVLPNPAKSGEDITVKGTITPKDFENVVQKKQIVLVIDISGSMVGDKISKLKIAAEKFVTKMSTMTNAEIAIVPFGNSAQINPGLDGYGDSFVPLDSSNAAKLNTSIERLSLLDDNNITQATNTGEGLRKAAYLLNKYDNSANKTIVFMSDGEPTKYEYTPGGKWSWGTYWGDYYYTRYGYKYGYDDNNKPPNFNTENYRTSYGIYTGYKYIYSYYDYYKDITKAGLDSNVIVDGSGRDDPDGNCLEYTKAVGQVIKDKGYNVFSIGYGLDPYGNTNTEMRAIHSSMSNNISNYFVSDTGAIDGVYNTIADKIIDNYTLNNITMNLNLSTDFTLNYGGNTVNIQNINYNRQTNRTDNKIVYHAESIPFEFTIKGNKQVTNYNVLQGAKLTVPWNGATLNDTIIPEAKVTITKNNLPQIKANLSEIKVNSGLSNEQSFSPNQNIAVNPEQPIDVTYKIDTDPFEYNINNSIGGMIDEAVFVVDSSHNMKNDNRWQIIQNWFTNTLLNDTYNNSDNALKNKNIKFGVVGYNESVIHPSDNGEYDKLFNRNDLNERETLRKFLQEPDSAQHESIYPQNNSNRNIGAALKKADYLLQFKGELNKNKAIVLINSGDVNYTQSDIDAIKNNGYKIISVDMSSDTSQNASSNLKLLHSSLLGNDNDYFISKNDGSFNRTQDDIQNIADRLKTGTSPKQLIVSGAKLNFDLGENFEAVENSGLDGTGKVRTVTIPDVKYTLVKDSYGNYKWNQTDPSPLYVTFKVKPVQGKTGQLGFANYSDNDPVENLKNFISYNSLDDTLIKKHIETPIVNVADVAIPKITAQVVNPPTSVGIFTDMQLEYKIAAASFDTSLIPVTGEKPQTYTIDTKLKFHTGSKFDIVSGLNKSTDAWYAVETPAFQVKYNLVNGSYVSDPVPNVMFTIKPNSNGDIQFGNPESEDASNNKLPGSVSYNNLFNKQIFNRIEPFNLNVYQIVNHGLYQNVDSGELSFIPGSVELPRGAIATLAIGAHIASSNTTITLQVNNNVDIISDTNPIKIYKIIDGKLSEIIGASYTKQGSSGDNNNYSISLPQGVNSETKLVIVYQCEIPNSGVTGTFVNKAVINGTESDFALNISAKQLPDLF